MLPMSSQTSARLAQPPSRIPTGPAVIGAGLMRSGTTSQMKALQILLGGRCYHMEFIMRHRRSDLKLWYQAATQGLSPQLAGQIFDGFTSCTDYPAAHFYRELAAIYPDAKFVLSVRDPQRWVQSVRATILRARAGIQNLLPPVRWLMGSGYFLPLMDTVLQQNLGMRFDMSDAELVRVFERHAEAVKRTIPADRLLVFRVSDGWEPLCKFLGTPVPKEPFPNVNDTAQFQRRVRVIQVLGPLMNLGFCSIVFAAVWFGAKTYLERRCSI